MSAFRTAVLMFILLFAGFAQASYSFDHSPRASDEELDRMRGGFIVNLNGLEFLMAFSLERLTFINGELVSSVTLNPFALTSLAQLGRMAGLPIETAGATEPPVSAQVPVAAADVPVQAVPDASVQSGGAENVSVATAVADSVTSEAAAASATVPLDQSVSGAQATASSASSAIPPAQSSSNVAATSSAPTAVASPQVITQGSLTVIQNGPGNTVALPADISANALTTIIQNSLNDQVIRNVTIMNATFAAKMLAAQARLNAMLDQGVRGLR